MTEIPQCGGLPEKGAAPLRNEVHVEVLNALRASILGAHLNGEISPFGLRKNAVTRPCS
jgi:hypothetical protein